MRGIDFEALSHHFGRDISDLKQESYASLEQMEDRMWKEKAEQEAKRRGNDDEYIRLLKKYFTMWNLLTRYWTEGEVIAASARHMGVQDLTEEHRVKKTANGSAYRGRMQNTSARPWKSFPGIPRWNMRSSWKANAACATSIG